MYCSQCGAQMSDNAAFCPKCGAAQDNRMQQSPEAVQSAGQMPIEKPKKRHMKMRVSAIIVILCLATVIPVIYYFNSEPYLYKTALESYENGDYAKAEKLFSRVMDYRDSRRMLKNAWYFHAKECVGASEYGEALDLLHNYEAPFSEKDGGNIQFALTTEQINELAQLKEQIAEGLKGQGKYDEAVALYQELGNTWEAAKTCAETENYLQALEITEDYQCDGEQRKTRESWKRAQSILFSREGRYEEALEYMEDYAGDYDDEWGQAVYRTAGALADNQKYEEAILLIDRVKGHMEEAEVFLAECYENYGILCAQGGDYETAWKYFSLCDVTETAKPYIYDVGRFYMDKGSYQEAITVWNHLPDYEDCNAQLKECYRLQGAEYEQKQQYSKALELYEECGDADLIVECRYRWAAYAYGQKDYDQAVKLFTELNGYADSTEMLLKCRYDQAGQAFSQEKYNVAVEIYTELGSYEDSAEKLLQAQEQKEKEDINNEKKARLSVLDGTWITSDDNLAVIASGTTGGSLKILMAIRYSSVTTLGGTSYGYSVNCDADEKYFDGADAKVTEYLRGETALSRTYYWNNWDYRDGILYVDCKWEDPTSFSCTVNRNTMTLYIGERKYTLTKG